MKIVCLLENTQGIPGCVYKHGLSLYIETQGHRILMDTGPDDSLIINAEKLGIDLTSVDTAVISHGHYDHGGGLEAFMERNRDAGIYIQDTAFKDFYSRHGEELRYIGLSEALKTDPRLQRIQGFHQIDELVSLFAGIGHDFPVPDANQTLFVKKDGALIPDDFDHEQCLVIEENGKYFLFSGCAHHGILNILERFRQLYRCEPSAVFSGFHMHKRNGYTEADFDLFRETAEILRNTQTVYYTCHCTGETAYRFMAEIMGDRLQYIHCGDTVCL